MGIFTGEFGLDMLREDGLREGGIIIAVYFLQKNY